MKYDSAALLAALLILAPAGAQIPPAPTPPVEQTEAPEDKATDPEEAPDPLPAPEPKPAPPVPVPAPAQATAPAAAAAEAKPHKWNVNAPPGAVVRQIPI